MFLKLFSTIAVCASNNEEARIFTNVKQNVYRMKSQGWKNWLCPSLSFFTEQNDYHSKVNVTTYFFHVSCDLTLESFFHGLEV